MSPATPPTSGGAPDLRAVAIIPARLASERLPRKMLLEATGLPLCVHTARNVRASGAFVRVVLAVDSEETLAAAARHQVEARMTRVDHQSGSDRVNECFSSLRAEGERADVVVNVQGDEPDVEHDDLARLVGAFRERDVEMATLAVPLDDEAQFQSASVVKVVCDARGDALYFSRAPIPARGHARESARSEPLARRHVGVYAFRPETLERFCALPRGVLETRESLEQLRWLENGGRLRVLAASRAPRGIDTRADYDEFVARTHAAKALKNRPETGDLEKARAG